MPQRQRCGFCLKEGQNVVRFSCVALSRNLRINEGQNAVHFSCVVSMVLGADLDYPLRALRIAI